MRFLVIGEPFPESLRASIRALAGHDAPACPILSVYGSADTGLLGAESIASAAARQALNETPSLAASLGLPTPIPHLFHLAAPDAFLETVNGELCVTRWQGVPLVRYNLHDRASLLSWRSLREAILSSGRASAHVLPALQYCGDNLPELVAIAGRADRCLILCGTNLTEPMFDEALARAAASGLPLTGRYRASIIIQNDRQRLALDAEVNGAEAAGLVSQVYVAIIQALGHVQPEFRDDWINVYRIWDQDPDQRIIRLSLLPWPALTDQGSIKSRGIVT